MKYSDWFLTLGSFGTIFMSPAEIEAKKRGKRNIGGIGGGKPPRPGGGGRPGMRGMGDMRREGRMGSLPVGGGG